MGAVVELDAAPIRRTARIASHDQAHALPALDGEPPCRPLGVPSLVSIAQDLARIELFDDAARILRRHIAAARAEAATPLPHELTALAELETRLGDLAAACTDAHEAVRLAPDLDRQTFINHAEVIIAWVESLQGRERECRSRLAAARTSADSLGLVSSQIDADSVLGGLELSLGHPQGAIRALEPIASLTPARGVADANTVPWRHDLIEAYIRVGRSARAERELDVLERGAGWIESTWTTAGTLRCRGLLAPVDRFETLFARALALHATQPLQIDLARTKMCFGERLRRAGLRRKARAQLGDALDIFELTGAHLWATRTRAELLAAGEYREPRPPSGGHALTAQELQVAHVVAEGATNAEVAARLFISAKTVEKHLTSSYRKLGIRSRSQLVRQFAPTLADWSAAK